MTANDPCLCLACCCLCALMDYQSTQRNKREVAEDEWKKRLTRLETQFQNLQREQQLRNIKSTPPLGQFFYS